MVTVYNPRSPTLPFPYLYALIIPSPSQIMPTSPTSAEQNTTSVFKALGSYADRIRENGVNIELKPASSSTTTSKMTKSPAPPKASATASGSTKTPASAPKSNSAAAEPATAPQPVEDDGPWETVQSARVKSKQDKDKEREQQDKGSNSRNWRDRPTKEKGSGSSSKENVENAGEGRKAGTSSSAANHQAGTSSSSKSKRATSSAPATRSGSEAGKPAATTTPVASTSRNPAGPPSKPAWSTPVTSQKATGIPTSADASTSQQSKSGKGGQSRARTAPSSPLLNGTTAANSSVGDNSPQPSTETHVSSALSTTAAAKENGIGEKGSEAKDSVKISEKADEKPSTTTTKETTAPVTPAIPKAAPTPPTNVWATRQKSTTPATALSTPTTASAADHSEKSTPARLQFGELSPSLETPKSTPNGHAGEPVKIGGKKKKKDAASVVGGQTVVMDASQWPDVVQAQTVVAETPKSEAKKETKQVEDQQDESTTTKKPKWKAIPASELLAAADEAAAAAAAAEANKRQQRKRGSKQGESSTSPTTKTPGLPGKPRKGGAGDGKRGEIRLPPNPNAQAGKSTFKPTFGSLEPGSELTDEVVSNSGDAAVVVNGASSTPLSRQTSKTSQSPVRTLSDHSIPLEQAIRLGAGPLKASGQTHQNATAPLPQQPFASASSGHTLPRPPRGGRNSFSGRGRGGGRGGRFDPNFAGAGAGHANNGGNVYAQGYGMGYAANGFYGQHAAYPAGAPGVVGHQQPMFDPMQAQWFNMQMYGRGPMPPPPTPQTVVAGLNMDPLRFYVLGQVEYYFSMQNLAMDYFFRQQMDSEGWISIAMIASFNRIKSLTPEVSMVKEMMELSSILEVHEDHVRLRGSGVKKWILPTAKPSTFPPISDESTPSLATPSSESMALDGTSVATASQAGEEPLLESVEILDGMGLDAGFGADYQHKPGGVADALMKNNNSSSNNASSSASVLNGEEESVKPEESTPGTSVVGEGGEAGDEDKADR